MTRPSLVGVLISSVLPVALLGPPIMAHAQEAVPWHIDGMVGVFDTKWEQRLPVSPVLGIQLSRTLAPKVSVGIEASVVAVMEQADCPTDCSDDDPSLKPFWMMSLQSRITPFGGRIRPFLSVLAGATRYSAAPATRWEMGGGLGVVVVDAGRWLPRWLELRYQQDNRLDFLGWSHWEFLLGF